MFARQQAIASPDKPAIIMASSGETVTFGEYEARSNRVAHLLRDAGLRRGDHIAVFIENSPQLLEIEGGAERAGLYYSLINTYLGAAEVEYIVANSQAKVLFSSAAKREVAEAAAANSPALDRKLMTGPDPLPAGWESYDAAVAGYPADPVPDESLGAAMLYSSGTTGQPKGILRELPTGGPDQPLPVMEFVKCHVRVPRGHDLPQPGTAVSLGAPGERGGRAAPGVHGHRDGALRSRAVAGPCRALPGDPLPDGAGDVQPAAPPPRGSAGTLRHLIARVHRPRGRAMSCPRQAGDDRLARPRHHGVLRGHGGQRLHVLHHRRMARASWHCRPSHPRRTAHLGRRGKGSARPGQTGLSGSVARPRSSTSRIRRKPRTAARATARPAPWGMSATSTRTGTCT